MRGISRWFAVSHVKGHIAANYIDSDLKPPYLCLLASGGHTAIVKVEDYEHIELIAQSRDDACGEAFDKVARVLGLPYPGGPEIQKLAREGKPVYNMPEPKSSGLDDLYFSYSGLKTFVINLVHNLEQKGEEIPRADIAASFQKCAVSQLVDTLEKVIEATGIKDVAGGRRRQCERGTSPSFRRTCKKRLQRALSQTQILHG